MSASRRALISVYDKSGLLDLARGLADLGFEIVSTGGTARALAEAGIAVTSVAAVTGFPEILGGRVKSLHPAILGGILADPGHAEHRSQLARHSIAPIELVVANLYPFRTAAARPGAPLTEVVEMIDVGGPTMVRAAAKNHAAVAVVVDPDDYPAVLAALREADGALPEPLRRRLAAKAFRHTGDYDAAIAAWLDASRADETIGVEAAGQLASDEGHAGGRIRAGVPGGAEGGEPAAALRFPPRLALALEREIVPRYGENPHQQAAVYRLAGGTGLLGGMRQLQGKQLSYNNLLDADAARRLVGFLAEPAAAIVKHTNPCGVGRGATAAAAYRRALECDPISAFGSIIAVNRTADGELAVAIGDLFVEVLVAPDFTAEALAALAARASLRLLACPLPGPDADDAAGALELRSIGGGLLAQVPDTDRDDPAAWTCPTRRSPTAGERRALELAWAVCRCVKSNAIVVANAEQTVGVGAGQMSRVDACRLAIERARLPVAGCAAASDAFFPFADGLQALAAAGVTAVVQPGGSKRDAEVIAAADDGDVAMVFTGRRHFRH